MLVHFEQTPTGPRCHILGRRVHHGLVGLITAGAGVITTIVGVGLVADDRADWRVWLRDLRKELH